MDPPQKRPADHTARGCTAGVIFFRGTHIVRNNFGSIFNYNIFRGLGLRIRVRVMVRARVSVWVRVGVVVGVRVSVVLWSW